MRGGQGAGAVCRRLRSLDRSCDQPRNRRAARQRYRSDAAAVQRQELCRRACLSRRQSRFVGFRRPARRPAETIELAVDSVRIERREDASGHSTDDTAKPDETLRGRASSVTLPDGLPVATYPEWDYAAGTERMDWATVLEADAAPSGKPFDLPTDSDAMRRITRLTRDASIGRRLRHKAQRGRCARHRRRDRPHDCAARRPDRRAQGLSARCAGAARPRHSCCSTCLHRPPIATGAGRTVLDVERKAAAIMAVAVVDRQRRDRGAWLQFGWPGARARYLRIKGFDEPMDAVVRARFAGIGSSHSTRLRHRAAPRQRRQLPRRSAARSGRCSSFTLPTGNRSDIDAPDPQYLTEDARRTVQQLRRARHRHLCVRHRQRTICPARPHLRRAPRVSRAATEVLPQRVMQLYTELKK